MPNLIIKKREMKDLFSLIKIIKDSFPSWIRHVPYLIFSTLIAKKNSKITGFVVLLIKSKRVGEVSLIATDKDYRGEDIGSKLLTEALNYFKLKGKKYCTAKIRTSNPEALKFYKNHGFQIEKIKKRPFLGDVYLVIKKLV